MMVNIEKKMEIERYGDFIIVSKMRHNTEVYAVPNEDWTHNSVVTILARQAWEPMHHVLVF